MPLNPTAYYFVSLHLSPLPRRQAQGANGAGKTTTFKVVTGEVSPDAGDACVAGASALTQRAAARRALGYCPQFDGLPAAMTAGGFCGSTDAGVLPVGAARGAPRCTDPTLQRAAARCAHNRHIVHAPASLR